MMRALEVSMLFLGFGLVGAGGDYASEMIMAALRDEPDSDRVIEVDVEVPRVDVVVQVVSSGACAYEAQRSASVPASAGELLRVSAGSGELAVRGVEGLGEVRVVARACASASDDLDDLQITLEDAGAEIVLSAHYPERSASFFGGNRYARLDLVVEVPLSMAADIEDGSGSMELSGTGALRIQDSSGDILVSDALGPVEIEDSSGEIELVSVTGGLTIQDSSGEIRIENAAGAVQIEDGSGEIELRVVEGDVRIEDGSGSIDAEQVSGSVTVEADGSGEIEVRDVTGDFTVLRDGSGSIQHQGVGGRVDIPVRGGRRGDG
jgi:hypothetical protein